MSSFSNFNPRPPRGERPNGKKAQIPRFYISIHALREESDPKPFACMSLKPDFNPRPPRGERRRTRPRNFRFLAISIHALREESDWPRWCSGWQGAISIHALREESDSSSSGPSARRSQFQSTPSARRATIPFMLSGYTEEISIHALREESDPERPPRGGTHGDFNPRPPRGERPICA